METSMKCRVVPAIDLIDGKVVRLERGDFTSGSVVAEDPVEAARSFESQGFSRLHLVDLDGARQGRPQHLGVLSSIAQATSLTIDFSGGLRSKEDIEVALNSGASQVVVGSAAVLQPQLCTDWLSYFGGKTVVLGLDLLAGQVRVKGWQEGVGMTVDDVIGRYLDVGLTSLLSTEISRDGMLAGPEFDLYRRLRDRYPNLNIIASGGVACAEDIKKLAQIGVVEVVVGKALYTSNLSVNQLQGFVW
jgi:phosphoribosylformimino-5-aminoimidazole carboxamide ribotide isomerase